MRQQKKEGLKDVTSRIVLRPKQTNTLFRVTSQKMIGRTGAIFLNTFFYIEKKKKKKKKTTKKLNYYHQIGSFFIYFFSRNIEKKTKIGFTKKSR